MTANSPLLAGVARGIITPPKGIYLIGYGDRSKGNTGVHDDLTVTALVLDNGTVRIAVVALDILTINEFIVDRIRAALSPAEVVLCCSHTHSGPIAFTDEKSSRKRRTYIDLLVSRVVDIVQLAGDRLSPARLAYAAGQADIGINRREKMPDGHIEIGRNPEGLRDGSVQVVSVMLDSDIRDDIRLATVVNYACHGTVLGPDNLLVSADWIGAMRQEIESQIGGLTLFLQGATADINPDMYWEDESAFEKVAEQGRAVAAAVLEAVSGGSQPIIGLPLSIEREQVWLPTETPAESARPPRNYAKPLIEKLGYPGYLRFIVDLLLNQRYPWKSIIEARDGFWAVPMRVNALRIGELALVTFAAETFTEIGLKVKSESPASHTLFASVSDGCISYLHTAASHDEGGYEVDVAPLLYRYPGRLQAGCEGIALDRTDKLLNRLWD